MFSLGNIDPENMSLAMFEEAEKIQRSDLKNKCHEFLIKNINPTNCLDTIIVADRCQDADNLKQEKYTSINHRKKL